MEIDETIKYLLVSKEREIVFSNIPNDKQSDVFAKEFKYISANNKKEQKKECEYGWIYLCMEEKHTTKKMFDKCMMCYESIFKQINKCKLEIKENYDTKIKRFKHNIESYGAKIQDELGEYINLPHSDTKNYIESIDTIIKKDNAQKTAKTLLRISKQTNSINREIEVYKIMSNDNSYRMYFSKHSIRKLIDLSIQSFFLDFVEKGITIERTDTQEEVSVDYPTFSVVLAHVLDNCVKYCIPDSSIKIRFLNNGEMLEIQLIMTSLFVEPAEKEYLFNDGYSGLWATNLTLKGNGLGMYYAKYLMEKNLGWIEFCAGNKTQEKLGVPYAENIVKIGVKKSQAK